MTAHWPHRLHWPKRPRLLYRCTEQRVRDEDGIQRSAYRLHVADANRPGDVLCAVDDVCSDGGQARALEALLTRNRVSLVHILDVVEDWVAEQALAT